MNKKLLILLIGFISFEFFGCQTAQTSTSSTNICRSERLFEIGKSNFTQNKYLEALGPFYEASYYCPKNLKIECYIGLCLSYIEESNRGKQKIDNYIKKEKDKDPYILNKAGNVYGCIFREYKKALALLDMAIEINNASYCWDYIEKGYIYLYLNNKNEAIYMFNIAFDIAKKTNDASGMETAPQLIEQIEDLLKIFQERT